MVIGIIFRRVTHTHTRTTHAGLKEKETEFVKKIADPLWEFREGQYCIAPPARAMPSPCMLRAICDYDGRIRHAAPTFQRS
jgi:hypothetical protein